MAEITHVRKGELIRGVFSILLDHPEGLLARTVLHQLEAVVPPTEYESGSYPSQPDGRRYEKIVRFSTIAAVKAGWLEKSKGQWTLTDEGITAYETHSDPAQFNREAGRLYQKWKARQTPEESVDEEQDTTSATATLEEAEESAWAEIESYLEVMNPYDFQDLVAGLLRGMGYHITYVSPPGPDRGIDVIAYSDPLGVSGPRIVVQVKRRKDRATVDSVRGFMAILGDTDVGLFVCTGGFTRDSEDEARRQEKRRVTLVDAKRLLDLWAEYYAAIPDEQRRLLPLKPVHYLDPDD